MSESGVCGDPTVATVEFGRALFEFFDGAAQFAPLALQLIFPFAQFGTGFLELRSRTVQLALQGCEFGLRGLVLGLVDQPLKTSCMVHGAFPKF